MHQMHIVNAGYFFQGVWMVIKPWLDPVTQKKIHIHTGSGKKELMKIIPEEILPVFLGGQFEGDIKENLGPWKETLEKSIKTNSSIHPNQKLVDQYFLTEQEQQAKQK